MTTPLEEAQLATDTALEETNQAQAYIEELEVTDAESQEFAAGVLRGVKEQHKEVEKERKKITGPMNQALKAVNDLFRPVRTSLEKCEKILKGKIAVRLREVAAANHAALEAASTAAPEEAAAALSTVVDNAPPAGVSVRTVWKWRVIAADLVPDAFRCPDLERIAAHTKTAIETQGKPSAIPGVEFYTEDLVTSRQTVARDLKM